MASDSNGGSEYTIPGDSIESSPEWVSATRRCFHPQLSDRDPEGFRLCLGCGSVLYDPPPTPLPPVRTLRMVSQWYSLRF